MNRIFAFTEDAESLKISGLMGQWVRSGLINQFFSATCQEGASVEGITVRHFTGAGVSQMTFENLLDSLIDVPMVISVCLALSDGRTLPGKTAAELAYRKILEAADVDTPAPKAVVLASASPSIRLNQDSLVQWNDRYFLVPEDRVRPSASLGHLDPASFPGHVAAGLVSLCGLWKSGSIEFASSSSNASIIEELIGAGTPGPSDFLYPFRQFTRIVEFTTMIPEILAVTGKEFEAKELPNPDQTRFERSSLQGHLPSIAKAFIAAHDTLQVGVPRLLPPEPLEVKLNLIEAIRRVVSQALQQLVVKPAQILDDVLGHYHDEMAHRVEKLAPGGSISVVRWRELGRAGSSSESFAEDFAQEIDRLAEPDMTKTWTELRELTLGFLDGSSNEGTKIYSSHLFQSSQNRQTISPYPAEIVIDPFAQPQIVATSPSELLTGSDESVLELTQVLTQADAMVTPLTTLIRREILDGISNSADNVAKYREEKTRSQEVGEESPLEIAIAEQKRVEGQISKTVRSTFFSILLSISLSLGGAFFLNHRLHGFIQHAICGLLVASPLLMASARFRSSFAAGATVVEIALISQLCVLMHVQWRGFLVFVAVVLALQSPLWLAMSIWKSAQLQRLSERAIREALRSTYNTVLSEAHFISTHKRLERRLIEFEDWEYIIGLVAHRPYSLSVVAATPSSNPELGFPASVAHGMAHLAPEDVVRIASDFRRALFAPGWLNQRFAQLREPLIEELYIKLGVARENGVISVEGDTSSDMQAPRKIFRESLEILIRNQSISPVVERLDAHLRDSSISTLVDHIEYRSSGGLAEEVSSSEFLDDDLSFQGSLLPSHWRGNVLKDSATVSRNMRFGDTGRMRLLGQGEDGTPKVIVGTVQLTERLSPSLLATFEKDDE